MVVVLAPVAGVALGSAIGDVKGCTKNVELSIAASPEIAPVLSDFTQRWSQDAPPSKGMCVTAAVEAVDSASMAAAYAESKDRELDLRDADIEEVDLPDVWIPESMNWLSRLGGDLDGTFSERVESVAESPVGLAVDEASPQAEAGAMFTDTPVATDDPHSDAASLTLLLASEAKNGPTISFDDEGPQVMSKAAVQAHNADNPEEKLTYIDPSPALPAFDYPYVTPRDAEADTKRGAQVLLSVLVSEQFSQHLASHDMRSAGPYPSAPEPEKIDEALQRWEDQ